MNRRTFLAAAPAGALLVSGLAPVLAPQSALAQTRVTADVVAARVQAFYEQTRTVQARFQQHYWHRVYQRTDSSSGQMSIQRPGRIRFDYRSPAGKVLVSDGTTWTMYLPPEAGEANGQYARGSSAAASTGALGFLMGTARLTDFRRALRAASASQPSNTDALDLLPRRPDPHFRRIVVYVDNQAASLGVVRRVSIEDPDGNWNRFDFSDLRFNRELPADTFTFTPPSGAREMSAPDA